MAVLKRLTGMFRRGLDHELDAELGAHIEMRVEQNIAEGMTPDEARRDALRRFGNPALIKEEARRFEILPWMESVAQDARYALRNVRHHPTLTAVIVLSLALGIGANTAIFGVIDAVMLQALPVRDPGKLQLVTVSYPKWPASIIDDVEGSVDEVGGRHVTSSISSAVYEHLRDRNQVFSSVVAFTANEHTPNIGLNGRAVPAIAVGVSGNFFQGLGVDAALGRALVPQDDGGSAPPVAVVSYEFWRRHLRGDAAAIGTTMTVDATPVTIVGVAPGGFTGVQPGLAPDLWIPLSLYGAAYRRIYEMNTADPKVWWLGVIGRLKPEVTAPQAETQVNLLLRQTVAEQGGTPTDLAGLDARLVPASGGLSSLRRDLSTPLLLLMGMVGLVLLIACANVAGLLLAKATARQREIAVRLSLGAGLSRVARQVFTESVCLAAMGGVAGLAVSRLASAMLMALLESGKGAIALHTHVDARVLGFTAAVSLAAGLLFGLAPAMRATRTDVFPTLKRAPGAVFGGGRFRAGKLLVTAQVALCIVLLAGASLLVKTLRRLQAVDLGFQREALVSFEVAPGLNGYRGAALTTFYRELQQRTSSVPGVEAVGYALLPPLGDGWSQGSAAIPGAAEPGKSVPMYRHYVAAGYFNALGVPVLLGRGIGEQDTAKAPRVAVVNRTVVRQYFAGKDPIGRTLAMVGAKNKLLDFTIVGVVGDVKYGDIRKDAPPTAYFSVLQTPFEPVSMNFFLRTRGDTSGIASAIRAQALALDGNVPVRKLRTENEIVREALYLERAFAMLSSCFGALALLLACVGLYGTMQYTVSRRTNEFGVRMALGAMRADIVGMVLREALLVIGIGIAAGVPLALAATALLKHQLFELSPHDPATLAIAIAAILAVGVISGLVPARNAARVDPMVALRYE